MTLLDSTQTEPVEWTPSLRPAAPGAAPPPVEADLAPPVDFPSAQERLAHIVRTIEADIIPRLLRAHPHDITPALRSVAAQPHVDPVSAFATLVLAASDEAWADAVEAQLARGVCTETLCMDLLVPTARELGRMWEDDEIGFTDVTVGVGRLQRALRALAPDFDQTGVSGLDGRRVLLMMVPGDDHTFGISVVAEFFRRAGWDVVGHSDARCAEPLALVTDEWFDVVGLSTGDGTRLELLPALISALRGASRNPSLAVLLGGPQALVDTALATRVGADGLVTDARLAPAMAEKMLETRTGRLPAASS
jgi:methylmalonyl-CoA mutase cobalamin-binding domain/chain